MRMSITFRAQLVLMVLGAYGFGDRVNDERAFPLRVRAVLREQDLLRMGQDVVL